MNMNKFFKKVAGIFLAAALMSLAACGNKGGNNNVNPQILPVTPFQQCINCQSINGVVFFTAESVDYTGSLHLNWSFAGQNNMTQSYPYNYGSSAITPGTYYGPVATSGQFSVSQNMNLGFCVVPAGVYSIATVKAGQWGYGIASGLALQAINGAFSMFMTFEGQISSPGFLQNGQPSSSTNQVGRMFGNLRIETINGQQCQQVIGIQ